MEIELVKASGKAKCRGLKCKRNPDFVSNKGRIKMNTTCAAIKVYSSAGIVISYYCRDCIDQIYLDIKTMLNPKLWVFL